SNLGANSTLGASLACAHAAARVENVPLWRYLAKLAGDQVKPGLPVPMVNMISGGLHAGGNLDLQDFLVIPVGCNSFAQGLERAVDVYRSLGDLLTESGFEGRHVGDEGGYGPKLRSNEQAIELILRAMDRAGYRPGHDAALAIDVASSRFYRNGRY